MRITFMGTPEFAVPTLQALIDSPDHDVVAVYSQPPRPSGRGMRETPSPVHQLAEKKHIPVFTPTSLKSPETQAIFIAHMADIAVVAAYGLLLPQAILDAYPHGCLNIHPSDLPRWRGAAPIQRTIMAGDTLSAMCIMQMNAGLDTGDVLLRQPVRVNDDMTAGELHEKMAALGAECLLKTLELHERLEPQPQSDAGVTYAHKITKDEAMIDWSRSSTDILNHIRGLNPYPAAQCEVAGEIIKVFDATLVIPNGYQPEESNQIPPRPTASVGITSEQLSFQCGDGKHIRITELQRAGKKRMSTDDALRGWPEAKQDAPL